MTPPDRAHVPLLAPVNVLLGGMGLASLLVLGILYGPSVQATFRPETSNDATAQFLTALDAEQPGCRFLLLAAYGTGIFLSVVLLVSGFGLLAARPWGRRLGTLYGFALIAVVTAGLPLQFAYVHPAIDKIQHRAILDGAPEGPYSTGTAAIILVGAALLGILHACTLLSVTLSSGGSETPVKTVSEAPKPSLIPAPQPAAEWEDEPDEDDRLEEVPMSEEEESQQQDVAPQPEADRVNALVAVNGKPTVTAPVKAEWYYARDKQKVGPVALAELEQRLRRGEMQPADMVWREGTSRWVPLASVLQTPVPAKGEWYYVRDKQKVGPVSLDELEGLMRIGKLLPTDMVYRQGAAKWVELGSALSGLEQTAR